MIRHLRHLIRGNITKFSFTSPGFRTSCGTVTGRHNICATLEYFATLTTSQPKSVDRQSKLTRKQTVWLRCSLPRWHSTPNWSWRKKKNDALGYIRTTLWGSINAWSDNLILIKAQGVCERHNRIRLQCRPSAVFLKASNVNWQLYITHVLGSRISWIEMSCVFGHLHTRLTKTLTQVMLLHNLTLSFGIAEMKV